MLVDTPDTRLRRAVFAGLVAHPLVSTCHLNVMAGGGVVALGGYVTSHAQKDAAWIAARRVHGVTLVTNDIQVALPDPWFKPSKPAIPFIGGGPKRGARRYERMAQPAPSNIATILIVENEAIVRMELAAQLIDLGLKVLVACDADDAIVLLDSHPEIYLLLTDLTMPGSMDGIRLAHHVRKRWPPIKIIVTSGYPGASLSDLPPGSLFFPKPYAPETLNRALAPFLDGNGPRLAA